MAKIITDNKHSSKKEVNIQEKKLKLNETDFSE